MSTTSNFAAAALAASGAATSRSEARPLDRAPVSRPAGLKADYVIPDALGTAGTGVKLNIGDGRLEPEGTIAVTVNGTRLHTTMSWKEWLAATRERVQAACTAVLTNPSSTPAALASAEATMNAVPDAERVEAIEAADAAAPGEHRVRRTVIAIAMKFGIHKSHLTAAGSSVVDDAILAAM